MKNIIKLLINLAVITSIVYAVFFSVYKSENEEIILLKDLQTGRALQAYTAEYNFIWQGVMPWRFDVAKMPVKNFSTVNLKIRIPSLLSIADDAYVIKIPANISYTIDKKNLPDMNILKSKSDIDGYILTSSEIICQSVLSPYIEPAYDRANLLKNESNIIEALHSEIVKKISPSGVVISNIEFILPGYYPGNRLYSDGLIQSKEMRDLDFSNKKQEILLGKKILKEKYENELYFEKLLKISSILKDNPEILKFIYIDKMGDDVKVIISSDKTGLPAMFSDSLERTKSGGKMDVDNLR